MDVASVCASFATSPSTITMYKAATKSKTIVKSEPGQVDWNSTKPYPHRLNLLVWCTSRLATCSNHLASYDRPPLYNVTLEEFETCAIDRLRILAEIESSLVRNRQWDDLTAVTTAQCKKYLPLNANTAKYVDTESERRKDHLGHFVLRLAFCRSWVKISYLVRLLQWLAVREELRRRFIKAEVILFRVRYDSDDFLEKEEFLNSRDFDWIAVCLYHYDNTTKPEIVTPR